MDKKMAQCQDGRRRQARIQGDPKKDGNFSIWKATIRLKGKHVFGAAWYSHKTKAWYFSSDPEDKHRHLMDRIQSSLRDETIGRLHHQLKTLESQHTEHLSAMNALAIEIAPIKDALARLERGAPVETADSLEYSGKIRKS